MLLCMGKMSIACTIQSAAAPLINTEQERCILHLTQTNMTHAKALSQKVVEGVGQKKGRLGRRGA